MSPWDPPGENMAPPCELSHKNKSLPPAPCSRRKYRDDRAAGRHAPRKEEDPHRDPGNSNHSRSLSLGKACELSASRNSRVPAGLAHRKVGKVQRGTEESTGEGR